MKKNTRKISPQFPLWVLAFPVLAVAVFFIAKRFVYAIDFDLFTQAQTFDSILLSSDGPAENPKVATKNPTSPFGISIIKFNSVSGFLPHYSLADLKDIHFDYMLKTGSMSEDAVEIHFYTDVDNYTSKHMVRASLADLMGSATTDGWQTTPNAVNLQNNQQLWREITYPDNTIKEAWWQILNRYQTTKIDAVVLSLENPSSDYYFDNFTVNGDTWRVDDGFAPTPTAVPTNVPSVTPTPVSLTTKEAVLVAKGVDGKGIYWAPGLNKLIPNENFAGYSKN